MKGFIVSQYHVKILIQLNLYVCYECVLTYARCPGFYSNNNKLYIFLHILYVIMYIYISKMNTVCINICFWTVEPVWNAFT